MTLSKTIELLTNKQKELFLAYESWLHKPTECYDYEPPNQNWSIRKILEHVTMTNHFLLIIIRKGRDKALRKVLSTSNLDFPPPDDLDLIEIIGKRGSFRWIRPEHMEPTGNYPLSQIWDTYQQQDEELHQIRTSLSNGEGTLYQARMSVQDLGKLDLYQWIYFLLLHQERHLSQLQEVYLQWEQSLK